MNWTDERVETLKKLWSEGLSASQIAAELGGVTRNAVIGKVHRLKLSSRGRATNPAPRAKKPGGTPAPKPQARPQTARVSTSTMGAVALKAQFDQEPVARPMPRIVHDAVAPASRNLRLVELTERTCKWPHGDPLHEDFSFCGNDSAEAGPYCTYHSRLAYQPASERRRVR